MSNVPPPSSGLGSNSNYFLNNNCNNLDGVATTIDASTDIVASAGFGFQLNAYSPNNETCAIQQYVIVVDTSGQINCIVNNWQNASTALINNWVALYKLPSATLPAGHQCGITLQNDSAGNVTAATYTVRALGVAAAPGSALDGYWGSDNSQHVNFIGTDGHVHELYIHPGAGWVDNDLTNVVLASVTQTLSAISGVSSADLSPIVAFELDIVGYDNAQSTTLSSGSGTITYTAANAMTVVNAEPSCCEFDGGTLETANTVYGELPTGSSATFVQTFDKSSATIKAPKRNGLIKTKANTFVLPSPRRS
jgi:hypothetical protein